MSSSHDPVIRMFHCIFISLSALSILAFKVPPDSGERITLVITNLLSMIVFLLLVADILPPISDATPLISIYYAIVMFEVSMIWSKGNKDNSLDLTELPNIHVNKLCLV
jgi:hypothetical protein